MMRNGDLVLAESLDYETQDRLNFSVMATDGRQVSEEDQAAPGRVHRIGRVGLFHSI